MTSSQEAIFQSSGCDVRSDLLTRQLYATDASIYQIEPAAVAFPKTAAETSAVVRAAAEAGLSMTPRGAGTGLAGAALDAGLVIDLARHTRHISEFDAERRTVRVGPGVVLDQLNNFLKPHGLCFGPDVATSSRATLGGMIANNSSGARAPIYGTTDDHVRSLDIVLSDGRIATIGPGLGALSEERAAVDRIVTEHADEIRRRFHRELVKRWPGYAIDDYLDAPDDLTKIVAGSEGTLVFITSAVLGLMPLPKEKGIGLAFFASVDEAMQATVELLDLKPAAVEHMDNVLMDQTRNHAAFKPARDLLRLDEEPCQAVLLVEFYDDVADRLAAFSQRKLGLRSYTTSNPREMELTWSLRKAGLSLLTSRKGPAKPTSGLEDVCVRPRQLPEYVKRLEAAAKPLGLLISFYGHAASGLVHVRPVVDLHRAEDIVKYRSIAETSAALAKELGASFSAEHGVGISHTELMEDQVGLEILGVLRGIKALFDPHNRMNPGKIFDDGRYRIDTNLRLGAGYRIELPFTPVLAYCKKDESFVDHLEQCNGCGDCRKDPDGMCPTFKVTGEEIMVTRGRANTIRAALDGRLGGNGGVLGLDALDEALSNCLACKNCQAECPSNVDLALMKAELLHARHQAEGVTLRDRVVSRVDVLGALGCLTPRVANWMMRAPIFRAALEKAIGFSAQRPLPPYATQRFDRWFARHTPANVRVRGSVYLWDDCFVRYNEPHIGIAAVKVLEAAGYAVRLPGGRSCCGRPAFSMGCLDTAKRFGERNVSLFRNLGDDDRILFLEPSCYTMFVQDYLELKIPEAGRIAERCVLFERFMFDLLEREPDALKFRDAPMATAIHPHCHARALGVRDTMVKLAQHVPGNTASLLESAGCCGMAGAFGALKAKYDLSVAVAQPLVKSIQALPPQTKVVASGTSCRHQIGHLTNARPLHMAELLALVLDGGN